jgi:hypothetical protein
MPDPIPAAIRERIEAFLAAGATGQVVLHVVRGVVEGVDCNAMYRRRRDKPLQEPPDSE